MLVYALASVEGSRKDPNHVMVPGSVFEVEAKVAKRLIQLGAAREASTEDAALARLKGLLIEPVADEDEVKMVEATAPKAEPAAPVESKPAKASKSKAEPVAPTPAETTAADKADDVL